MTLLKPDEKETQKLYHFTESTVLVSMEELMKRIGVVLLLLLLLSGCARAQTPPDYAPGEENRLIIYTSHKEEVYRPIIREFEERTGIWVEVVTGGTTELLERIGQEKSAPRADVMFGGGVESLESCRELFRSVPCSEYAMVAPGLRKVEDVWAPFSALPVVLIYNTKLVNPGDVTGWADLLRPEFQGKIGFADPSKSGSALTALVTAIYACGEENIEPLARNIRTQLGSSGEVLRAVADGSCLVGVTLEETALQHIAGGDNLALVYPAEGTSCVPDGVAVVQGAPHGENAARFLAFTLSREVQELLGSRFYRRSVRLDVETPEALVPMKQIPLVAYDAQWAAKNREEILDNWNTRMQEAAR